MADQSMPSSPQVRVLLVEDNPSYAKAVEQVLAQAGPDAYTVTRADTLGRASVLLSGQQFDVALLDLSLPDSQSMQTVELAHAVSPTTPIVVLTANEDETLGQEAVRHGAQDFLIKGQADDRLIVRAIRYAIERRRILEERDRLIERLQAALGHVKKLSGLLPICGHCKKIRDDKGYWSQIDEYIREHSEAEFSHGICPECAKELFPEAFDESDFQQ